MDGNFGFPTYAADLDSLEPLVIPLGFMPDPKFKHWLLDTEDVLLHVVPVRPPGPVRCPECGTEAIENGEELRLEQTWPIGGHRTFLMARSVQYKCPNEDCSVHNFVPPSPPLPDYRGGTDGVNPEWY